MDITEHIQEHGGYVGGKRIEPGGKAVDYVLSKQPELRHTSSRTLYERRKREFAEGLTCDPDKQGDLYTRAELR